jgi:hypothetical protein
VAALLQEGEVAEQENDIARNDIQAGSSAS